MDALLFLPQYIRWHYTRALRDLYRNCSAVLLGLADFFAFETILSTFGASSISTNGNGSSSRNRRDSVSSSVFSFAIGFLHACIQIFLFVLGFLVLMVGVVLAALVSVVWLLYPFIIVALIALAIGHLF